MSAPNLYEFHDTADGVDKWINKQRSVHQKTTKRTQYMRSDIRAERYRTTQSKLVKQLEKTQGDHWEGAKRRYSSPTSTADSEESLTPRKHRHDQELPESQWILAERNQDGIKISKARLCDTCCQAIIMSVFRRAAARREDGYTLTLPPELDDLLLLERQKLKEVITQTERERERLKHQHQVRQSEGGGTERFEERKRLLDNWEIEIRQTQETQNKLLTSLQAQEVELKAKQEKVQRQEALLKVKQERLAADFKNLEEERRELKDSKTQKDLRLEEVEQKVAQQRKETEDKQKQEQQKYQQLLGASEQKLQELESQVDSEREFSNQLQIELETAKNELATQLQVVAAKEEALCGLQLEMQAADEKYSRYEQTMSSQQGSLSDRQQQLHDWEENLLTMKTDLCAKEQCIAQTQQRMLALQLELQTKQTQADAQDLSLKQQRHEFELRVQDIMERETKLTLLEENLTHEKGVVTSEQQFLREIKSKEQYTLKTVKEKSENLDIELKQAERERADLERDYQQKFKMIKERESRVKELENKIKEREHILDLATEKEKEISLQAKKLELRSELLQKIEHDCKEGTRYKQSELDKKEIELRELDTQLKMDRHHVELESEQLRVIKEELKEKEYAMVRKETDFTLSIEARMNEVHSREEWIHQKIRDLKSHEKQLLQQEHENQLHSDDLLHREKKQLDQESALTSKAKKVELSLESRFYEQHSKALELDKRDAQLKELDANVIAKMRLVEEKECQVANRINELEQQETAVELLRTEAQQTAKHARLIKKQVEDHVQEVEKQVATMKMEADEEAKRVEQRTAELQNHESVLAQQSNVLQARAREIESELLTVEQSALNLQQKEDEVQREYERMRKEHDMRMNVLQCRDEALSVKDSKLRDLELQLSEMKRQLADKDREIELQISSQAKKSRELEKLEINLNEQQQRLFDRQQALHEMDIAVKREQQQLEADQRDVSQQFQSLQDRAEYVKLKEHQITANDIKSTELDSQVSHMMQQKHALEKTMRELDMKQMDMNVLDKDLQERDKMMNKRQKDLLQQERTLHDKETELNSWQQSLSDKEGKLFEASSHKNREAVALQYREEGLQSQLNNMQDQDRQLKMREDHIQQREKDLAVRLEKINEENSVLQLRVDTLNQTEEQQKQRHLELTKMYEELVQKERENNRNHIDAESGLRQKEIELQQLEGHLARKQIELKPLLEQETGINARMTQVQEREKTLTKKEDRFRQEMHAAEQLRIQVQDQVENQARERLQEYERNIKRREELVAAMEEGIQRQQSDMKKEKEQHDVDALQREQQIRLKEVEMSQLTQKHAEMQARENALQQRELALGNRECMFEATQQKERHLCDEKAAVQHRWKSELEEKERELERQFEMIEQERKDYMSHMGELEVKQKQLETVEDQLNEMKTASLFSLKKDGMHYDDAQLEVQQLRKELTELKASQAALRDRSADLQLQLEYSQHQADKMSMLANQKDERLVRLQTEVQQCQSELISRKTMIDELEGVANKLRTEIAINGNPNIPNHASTASNNTSTTSQLHSLPPTNTTSQLPHTPSRFITSPVHTTHTHPQQLPLVHNISHNTSLGSIPSLGSSLQHLIRSPTHNNSHNTSSLHPSMMHSYNNINPNYSTTSITSLPDQQQQQQQQQQLQLQQQHTIHIPQQVLPPPHSGQGSNSMPSSQQHQHQQGTVATTPTLTPTRPTHLSQSSLPFSNQQQHQQQQGQGNAGTSMTCRSLSLPEATTHVCSLYEDICDKVSVIAGKANRTMDNTEAQFLLTSADSLVNLINKFSRLQSPNDIGTHHQRINECVMTLMQTQGGVLSEEWEESMLTSYRSLFHSFDGRSDSPLPLPFGNNGPTHTSQVTAIL